MMYDLIIIGSSPASLIYALNAKNEGNKVVIIDNSDKIGGVWKKIYTKFGDEFELGPHLIANNPDAYEYIEEYLGCKMVETTPDPDIIFYLPGLKFVRLNWRLRFLYFLAIYFYNLITRQDPIRRKSIWKTKVCNTVKESIFLRNTKFKYPLYGSQIILDSLEKKLTQDNIDIVLNQHIQNITNEGEIVLVKTQNTEYEAKKILLTSNSHGFQLIDSKSEEICLEHIFREHHVYYMKFSGTKACKTSYTQIYTDKVCIRRIQDVTPYQNNTKEDEVLLAVHIKDKKYMDTDRIVNDLKNLKIIDKTAILMNSEFKTYKSHSLVQTSVEKIKRELNNVEYLDTSDLAVNLSNYLYKHRTGAT